MEGQNQVRGRWKHVLVDEFQDTNGVQYDVLKRGLIVCSWLAIRTRRSAGGAGPTTRTSSDVTISGLAYLSWRGTIGARSRSCQRRRRSSSPPLVEGALRWKARGSLVPSIVKLEDQDDEARWIADVLRESGEATWPFYIGRTPSRERSKAAEAGVSYQLLHAKGWPAVKRSASSRICGCSRIRRRRRQPAGGERAAWGAGEAQSLEVRVQALGVGGHAHAAAHAKAGARARGFNLKVFTDALDELREPGRRLPTPIPAGEPAGRSWGRWRGFYWPSFVAALRPFDARCASRRHNHARPLRRLEHNARRSRRRWRDRWRNVRELANLAAPTVQVN